MEELNLLESSFDIQQNINRKEGMLNDLNRKNVIEMKFELQFESGCLPVGILKNGTSEYNQVIAILSKKLSEDIQDLKKKL